MKMALKSYLLGTSVLLGACASNPATKPAAIPAAVTPAASASASASAPAVAPAARMSATVPRTEAPPADPSVYIGDPRLYALLAVTPLDAAARTAVAHYEAEVGGIFIDRVGEVAEDSSASVAARVNALNIIAARTALRQLGPVRTALHAYDPRVRATALNTVMAFVAAASSSARVIVRDAVDDPAPEIQAKALQFVGDEDVALLRAVAADASRPASVRTIARDMVQVAEERGAALENADTTGVLQRRTASGFTVRFVPVRRWPQWSAASGRVTVKSPSGKTTEIPAEIEVVGNVIPLFFSPDEKFIVYEADRHIRVRNIATGAERDIGAGIAPRVRPVTQEFLFMREDIAKRSSDRDKMNAQYDVMSTSFAAAPGVAPGNLGRTTAVLSQSKYGNYAPVRWMRVEDHDGRFFLSGEGLQLFPLPSPFESGSGN